MRHDQLDGYECSPRLSPDEARHSGIRQRLAQVADEAGPDGYVYINGQRFTADDFEFIRENFACPKPAGRNV